MRIFFSSFGCKVNASEEEYLASILISRGATIAPDEKSADYIVINSCAVTESAVKKCESYISDIRRKNNNVKIIATGCLANTDNNMLKMGADKIFKNEEKDSVIDYILNNITAEATSSHFIGGAPIKRITHTRAFFKIQDGCDAFCSYCIIPTLRGKPVSKPLNDAINEFKSLIKNDFKEIVFVGIHIGLYGKGEGFDLVTLLKEILKIDGHYRIRLSSVEVNEITDELIELIASNNKICPHLHIPLQSGSDKILQNMGRKYLSSDYIDTALKAKSRIKRLTIGSDIIVGFPNETDDDFEETIKTLQLAGTDFYHVFPYSDRKGTKATLMENKISEKVKKERADKLRKLGSSATNNLYKKSLGETFDILTEKGNKGHTENYILVKITDKALPKNIFQKVKITDIKSGKPEGVTIS